MPNPYHQEVLRALQPYANQAQGEFRRRYMNTRLHVLGLTVPQQRWVAKIPFSFFALPEPQTLAIWSQIWKETDIFEIRSLALLYYGERKKDLELRHWRVLSRWVGQVDNWAHSDALSNLFAYWHERYPRDVYPVYEQWIKARHPWKRRAALTGLFYYALLRRTYPPYEHVRHLLAQVLYDKDLYVQKAVGWTLRECYRVYPQQTYEQLKVWAPVLAPAAWYAAKEKLSEAKKDELRCLRAGSASVQIHPPKKIL